MGERSRDRDPAHRIRILRHRALPETSGGGFLFARPSGADKGGQGAAWRHGPLLLRLCRRRPLRGGDCPICRFVAWRRTGFLQAGILVFAGRIWAPPPSAGCALLLGASRLVTEPRPVSPPMRVTIAGAGSGPPSQSPPGTFIPSSSKFPFIAPKVAPSRYPWTPYGGISPTPVATSVAS